MADIPDFMREFDTDVDFGFTPVSKKPVEETTSQPSADPLELAKIKSDVSDIKSAMNEVMQIVACLLYTSPSPRDLSTSRMPSSA